MSASSQRDQPCALRAKPPMLSATRLSIAQLHWRRVRHASPLCHLIRSLRGVVFADLVDDENGSPSANRRLRRTFACVITNHNTCPALVSSRPLAPLILDEGVAHTTQNAGSVLTSNATASHGPDTLA